MTKSIWITYPFVLLLFDIWPLQRIKLFDKDLFLKLKNVLKEKAYLFVIIGIYIYFQITFFVTENSYTIALPFYLKVYNSVISYAYYFYKTIIPINLSIYHPLKYSVSYIKLLISVIFLLLMSAYSLYSFKKHKFILVGWFLFLGTLFPCINIFVTIHHAYADRYNYFPNIGIFIIFSFLIINDSKIFNKKRMFIFLIMLLSFYVIRSSQQISIWKDSISVWKHSLKIEPFNALAHHNLAVLYHETGDFEKALFHFSKSNEIEPKMIENYYNLGIMYFEKNDFENAFKNFDKVVKLNPKDQMAYYNLASILISRNIFNKDTKSYLKTSINLNPNHAESYSNLALFYENDGDVDLAVKNYKKAIILNPKLYIPYYNLGYIYLDLKDINEAKKYFIKLYEVRPDIIKEDAYILKIIDRA